VDPRRPRIAVLLSGSGTSLENLLERIDEGSVPGEVCAVVSSKANAFGLERARRRGIPAVAVPRKEHPDVARFNDALHAALAPFAPDLVLLLGFLSPFETRGRWDGRALNVHPALIPAFCGKGFYGHRVHEAVLAAGAKVSGATVHFVDAEYDHGPIVLQEAVPVREDDTPDTLAARVQAVERRLVPEAVRLFAAGRLVIEGRRVRVAPPRGEGEAAEERMGSFIAMNHFRVDPERGADFEAHWRQRETYLREVPGFVRFALLRGDEPGRYVSHSTWESRAAFEAWTRSEAFRKAHAQARTPAGLLQGHPQLELYEAVIEQGSGGDRPD
jgi:formyltetrahydrofolate-dependent phosphoribosylglycinamide formyltransferase